MMNLKNICLDNQEQSSYFSNKVKNRNKKAALFGDFFFFPRKQELEEVVLRTGSERRSAGVQIHSVATHLTC